MLTATTLSANGLRSLRHKSIRRYVEFLRQRLSADMAANKLSVPKRTGKFSTWSDDAATQQVAANRERTVRSNTTPPRCQYGHSRIVTAYHCSVMVRISVDELI
jgi:hypothetical protein